MERGQELNTERAQIRTLLDRQKEQILAECQAEIKRHGFHSDYDRRSVRNFCEIIESQQEELHCAQAKELQRRDQQLLHDQLLEQNWDFLEAHEKSLSEMEELKKFQSSTFRHHCKTKTSRGSGYYSGAYWKFTGIAKRNCHLLENDYSFDALQAYCFRINM